MTYATKRVLPADAYDALAQSAARYGGIGAYFPRAGGVPWCVWGHAESNERITKSNAIHMGLLHADIMASYNDTAVMRINRRRWFGLGRFFFPKSRRVSFAEWCAELGVERGA